jgi:hypothetical protein
MKRQNDATSKETLEDLEDEGSWDGDETDEDETDLSPDGEFDESDELEDSDPL